jgi:hypothetical protein
LSTSSRCPTCELPRRPRTEVRGGGQRIEGLSTDRLRKVGEYEKTHKDRETLIGQIDRKIRANNS